jgi:tRNA G10  N-methylase Trm11
MMVNLANIPKNTLILDPFCGSGTFLQEEILLGFENVVGSDLDIKAVEKSKKNLEWQFEGKKINIRSIDALQLSKYYKNVGAIISEPYLGSTRLRVMRRDQVFSERENLEKFYEKIFEEFYGVLKENGKLVFILPVIRYKNEFLYLDILDKIEKIGFKRLNYCEKQKELGLNLTDRGTIVYYRPGQTVSREIVIFNKI